jgi:hypothetical protein
MLNNSTVRKALMRWDKIRIIKKESVKQNTLQVGKLRDHMSIPYPKELGKFLKFIWALCAQLYLLAETPRRIWAHIRGRYWSAKIDDISLWLPGPSWQQPVDHLSYQLWQHFDPVPVTLLEAATHPGDLVFFPKAASWSCTLRLSAITVSSRP